MEEIPLVWKPHCSTQSTAKYSRSLLEGRTVLQEEEDLSEVPRQWRMSKGRMEVDWGRCLKTTSPTDLSESCLNPEELELKRFFFFLMEAMDGLEPESFHVNLRAGRQGGKQGARAPRKPEKGFWRSKDINLGFGLGLTKSPRNGVGALRDGEADIWMTISKWSVPPKQIIGHDSSGIIHGKVQWYFSTLYRHSCSHGPFDP